LRVSFSVFVNFSPPGSRTWTLTFFVRPGLITLRPFLLSRSVFVTVLACLTGVLARASRFPLRDTVRRAFPVVTSLPNLTLTLKKPRRSAVNLAPLREVLFATGGGEVGGGEDGGGGDDGAAAVVNVASPPS
jgi:hypothetical protein